MDCKHSAVSGTPLVSPAAYNARAAFVSLFEKEILRFRKIALQTILAPILTSILYLLVFGEVLEGKMTVLGGIDYVDFLIPGLVMMTLLQNSFANSASSILQSKIMGSIVFVLLAPLSGLQLAGAYICASIVRGITVGTGVLLAAFFWSVPSMEHPLWIIAFAILGSAIMASLGVICGLWADKYDQMGAFQNFVILPLTFLSGVFYSVAQLPKFWATASYFNPFFYLIDGFRYGFFGKSDFSPVISLSVTTAACTILLTIASILFVHGYKLRK